MKQLEADIAQIRAQLDGAEVEQQALRGANHAMRARLGMAATAGGSSSASASSDCSSPAAEIYAVSSLSPLVTSGGGSLIGTSPYETPSPGGGEEMVAQALAWDAPQQGPSFEEAFNEAAKEFVSYNGIYDDLMGGVYAPTVLQSSALYGPTHSMLGATVYGHGMDIRSGDPIRFTSFPMQKQQGMGFSFPH